VVSSILKKTHQGHFLELPKKQVWKMIALVFYLPTKLE
jgi:hypothetical protein